MNAQLGILACLAALSASNITALAQFLDVKPAGFTGSIEIKAISGNGRYLTGTAFGQSQTRAFRYDIQTQNFQYLQPQGSGQFAWSLGNAISFDGTIIGGESSGFRPQTRWNASGTPSAWDNWLGYAVTGMSNDGTIAMGQSGNITYRVANGVGQQLSTIGLINNAFFGTSISGDGNWIVGTGSGNGPSQQLLWRNGIGMIELPGSPPGNPMGGGISPFISRDGSTIVSIDQVFDRSLNYQRVTIPGYTGVTITALTSSGTYLAGYGIDVWGRSENVIWDRNRTAKSASQFLFDSGVNLPNGSFLKKIVSIEEYQGVLTIAGVYNQNFLDRPFVAVVVPEPSTLLILATLTTVLSKKRRKRVENA